MSSAGDDVDIDLRALVRGIFARFLWVVLFVGLVTGLAAYYAVTADPQYRAATRVLIETSESIFTRPTQDASLPDATLSDEGVASQVEVIASEDIVRTVVRQLNLADHPQFQAEPGTISRLLMAIGLASDRGDVSNEDRVIREVREGLSVYRIEGSRVIVIEYSVGDRELAASVPNAVADAYVAFQRDAIQNSTSDATSWLEPEIADLRERVRDAETRVAAYRAETGLLLTQNSEVLATTQLADLSGELSRVRAERAAAVARADSVRAALASGGAGDALSEVLASPVVQGLIARRGELNTQVAELSTVYLDNHPRIRAIRSQLADVDRQVRAETSKVLQALESEATAAERREQELVAELNRTKAASAQAGSQEVQLRALEREAAAERALLESYLTRYREASSRSDRNYLPVDARIFSRATPPLDSHFPKPIPIVGAALIGSTLVAVLGVILSELFSGRALRPAPGRVAPVNDLPLPPGPPRGRRFGSDAPELAPTAIAVTAPSAVSMMLDRGHGRALFVSPMDEPAPASSAQLLREAADGGLRAIFVDLTETGIMSAAMLESGSYTGITNLLCSECQLTETIHGDLYSEAHVIPKGTADLDRALRGVQRLPMILASLAAAYDLVVIECGAVDAGDLHSLIDDETFVFVATAEPENAAAVEIVEALHADGVEDVAILAAVAVEPNPDEPERITEAA